MSEDPHDQLLLQIRGAVAEYERTLITELMRRGRLARLRVAVLLPWTEHPMVISAILIDCVIPAGSHWNMLKRLWWRESLHGTWGRALPC